MRRTVLIAVLVLTTGCASMPMDELGTCAPPAVASDAPLSATKVTPLPGERVRDRGWRGDPIGALSDLASLASCTPKPMDPERRARERAFLERLEAQRLVEEIGQR